ncbi:hypothetical protein RJ640_010844 [Escallonia rubra]|uniref:Uncharacterized protein n=1 Tax=Escallonia rubra TaxID=112253 RepID=A0AA88UEQ0_9ASTE|nr:hypothetical protein RJ640_010844 [Escallonia rubra]
MLKNQERLAKLFIPTPIILPKAQLHSVTHDEFDVIMEGTPAPTDTNPAATLTISIPNHWPPITYSGTKLIMDYASPESPFVDKVSPSGVEQRQLSYASPRSQTDTEAGTSSKDMKLVG